jgi:hypothetical protein
MCTVSFRALYIIYIYIYNIYIYIYIYIIRVYPSPPWPAAEKGKRGGWVEKGRKGDGGREEE